MSWTSRENCFELTAFTKYMSSEIKKRTCASGEYLFNTRKVRCSTFPRIVCLSLSLLSLLLLSLCEVHGHHVFPLEL